MFRFVLLVAAIAAVNAGIIEDFISGEKYVEIALKDSEVNNPAKIGTECSRRYIVSYTGEIDACKGKSGLPIIKLKLDSPRNRSMDGAMISFDTVEERDAFEHGEVKCDKSHIKMLIMKPVDGITNIEVIIDEGKNAPRGELLLASNIPKLKDLEKYFSSGFTLECFKE